MSTESGGNDAGPKRRLLDQLGDAIRRLHYSPRTEEAYRYWIRRFIFFHGRRHPAGLGEAEVTAFLSFLASDLKVSASTQNQALAAVLFLYKEVLGRELAWLDGIVRAKRPVRAPVVLTRDEVSRLLAATHGQAGIAVRLLYGSGLRLMECLRLRVKDVDFGYRQILVRDGKGAKDRVTMLPDSLVRRSGRSSSVRAAFTRTTCARATARPACPSRWRASTRRRDANGRGSTCSRPGTARSIRRMA